MSNWRVDELNELLLASLRLRITLIVYFQLIMKILQKLILMSQPPKPIQWAAEKTARTVLSSWRGFGSARAKPQRTISFSFIVGTARRSLAKIGGREYLNSKGAAKVNVDKDTQSAP